MTASMGEILDSYSVFFPLVDIFTLSQLSPLKFWHI